MSLAATGTLGSGELSTITRSNGYLLPSLAFTHCAPMIGVSETLATGPEVKSAGPGWWVWALVGVGVVAAAGGTYYGISEATRPVTGTVTAKW